MAEENVIQINYGVTINVDVTSKIIVCVCASFGIFVWNPSSCNFKNGKYLASIIDDSVITCDEVIESYDEEIKTIPTNCNTKKYNL